MSAARDISGGLTNAFANQLSLSVSPISTFHSPSSSFGPRHIAAQKASKQLKPFNTGDVRILLLENVNETAQEILKEQGYQVEFHKSSLPEEELIEKIRYVTSAPPW
jgi:D-3-phosphoglycerate dehydrogenase